MLYHMEMFGYPIGIQLFNRPEYAEKLLVSLKQQKLKADQEKLSIFVDGFPGSVYESRGLADKSTEVKKLASYYFPKANVIGWERNLGIAALHVELQKSIFSTGSEWGAFFEEDVVLEPAYLDELSKLIEIVHDFQQIGKVACFQILPSLSHLPRGYDGFYPGRGTKAFAERKKLFDKKLPMLEEFVNIIGKPDLNHPSIDKDSLKIATFASRNFLGQLIPTMDHDIATDFFLRFNDFLHIVSRPYLATDIGFQGVHNSVTPKITVPQTTSSANESESRILSFRKSIDLITQESEVYAVLSYKKIMDGYYISQSTKKMLKQILQNAFRRVKMLLNPVKS